MLMSRWKLCLLLLLCAAASLRATADLTNWERVDVAPMKTSIYVGSVSLATGTFERQGSTLVTTYTAKVFPWFFWGETGQITITLTDTDLAKMARGENAEFTGEAHNLKGKLRTVTGRVQPASATSGKIKVRIMADGVELVFNLDLPVRRDAAARPAGYHSAQWKVTGRSIAGCRLWCTGQLSAAFSSTPAGSFDLGNGSQICTASRTIRRGRSADISFVTSQRTPGMSKPSLVFAAIAIIVTMHAANEAAVRSVGENASPRPWLSFGASVSTTFPDGPWVSSQLSSPW